MQRTVGQLLRYGFIGVAGNAIGYVVYLALTGAGLEPKLTMSLLYPIAATVAFRLNRSWTFAHAGSPVAGASRFVIAQFLGYVLNLALLYAFVDRAGYPHQWVQAAAMIPVAIFLFYCLKLWVFPVTQETSAI